MEQHIVHVRDFWLHLNVNVSSRVHSTLMKESNRFWLETLILTSVERNSLPPDVKKADYIKVFYLYINNNF